jgi:hypothetical protein
MAVSPFPCAACGFLTLDEGPGTCEICDVCGWEDDPVQLAYPRMRGGANDESLVEAQAEVMRRYPLSLQSVDGHPRDPEWRPLRDDEATDDGPRSGREDLEDSNREASAYYWRKRT